MDRRTIAFILVIGITFIGLNFFFSYQKDQQAREQVLQKQLKLEKQKALTQEEIEKKTPRPNQLPLVSFFLDSKETQKVATGFVQGSAALTLNWTSSPPQTIYIDGTSYELATKDAVKDGPILYTSRQFKNLDIAVLPDQGVFEVALLSFPTPGALPSIHLGELHEGELKLFKERLSSNALVIYKTTNGWLPVGFYTWMENIFLPLQNLPLISPFISSSVTFEKELPTSKEQKFYVLENPYQQLVFSNIGASLIEINLPFESEQNKESVVKEIEFDRQIAKESPENARFPQNPYYVAGDPDAQIGKIGGYYPLIRRAALSKKKVEIAPSHYALNIVSEYPELAELEYRVKEFSKTKIVFEAIQPHRRIQKTFSIDQAAPYCFDLKIDIEGDSRGLWITSGIPEVEIMSNTSSPLIQYRILRGSKGEVEKLSLPKPKEVLSVSSISPDWVVNSNGYLGVILDPLTDAGSGYRATSLPGNQVPTKLSLLDPQYEPYPASKYPGYEVLLPLPAKGVHMNLRVFAGPFEESVLKKVDQVYSDAETGYNPEYISCRTFYGWFSFISKPFAKLLFIVMKFFYLITHSWAFSIILLTVFLRVLLYPLNAWSIKSMRRMQQLSPQIQAIQQKYKKDPKKSQMEIMALYREKKVNPFTGCIPIVIQLPFLIAMFDLLKSSFQLRGASFIPGWIENLTAPDVLFQWSTPIFFIGNQFHLLPIILGAVMFIQQRFFSATPTDPSKMTDQQRQQKAMSTIMTIVFTVMFYKFPSGLNLYWLSSMILGIFQQWITNKMLDKKKKSNEIEIPVKKLSPKRAK